MDYPAITKERVERVLTSLELSFDRDDDDDIVLGFENSSFYFTVADNILVCHGVWDGRATTDEDRAQLRLAVNDFNGSLMMGSVVAMHKEDVSTIKVELPYFLAEGVSDEQLEAMITSGFDASMSTFALMEERFPHLVTWDTEGEEA